MAFRVDGNSTIGAGHFVRCLSLARAAKRMGIEPEFFCRDTDEYWRERATRCGVHVHQLDSEQPEELIERISQDEWIVIDGYQFGSVYFAKISESGVRSLVLDDCGDRTLSGTAVLNGNPYASDSLYPNCAVDLKLLGPQFAPLDLKFADLASRDREVKREKQAMLVTFGGSNLGIATSALVFEALAQAGFPGQVIYVGPLSDQNSEPFANLEQATHYPSTEQMPTLMSESDMAITASGSTTLELACLGVPVAAVKLAENQNRLSAELARRGIGIELGNASDLDLEIVLAAIQKLTDLESRLEMRKAGQNLVDGYGCDRVLMRLYGFPIRLRRANWSDCEVLFKWANDPETRSASLNSDPIALSVHQTWFRNRLEAMDAHIYMAVDVEERACGVVRFECPDAPENFRLSFTVAPEHRGCGIGAHLVELGIKRLAYDEPGAGAITAESKTFNVGSQRIMERAGFQQDEARHGNSYVTFRLNLN